MKRVVRWLLRHALLFVLLVAALAAHRVIGSQYRSFAELRATATTLGDEAEWLRAFAGSASGRSEQAIGEAQRLSAAALDDRIAAAARERDARAGACGGDLKALLRGGAGAVVANRQRCIEGGFYAREATILVQLRDTVALRRPGESLGDGVRRQARIMREAAAINVRSRQQIALLERQTGGRFRYRTDIDRFRQTAARSAARYDAAKRSVVPLVTAYRTAQAATATAEAEAAKAQAALDALVAGVRRDLGGNLVTRTRGWAEWLGIDRLLLPAALALAGIVAMPFLIRLLFYFVLAPLAARRPAIRLRVPKHGWGVGGAIPLPDRSATSVGIALADGEELFVRQGYLQTSGEGGPRKRTRFLLDWRHPLSSLASGLYLLTRVPAGSGITTVSAVHDPLAEVAMLDLPEGTACVLQPRGLAAMVQRCDRPLRITRHWRLFSLNAWLTLQLRYLVFHGPVRLALKGSRGVRVERAAEGRVFGQDQLIGFSADLLYSVTRTETLWPYLVGRESLLKDRVRGGDGILIVEEAPLASRRVGEVRHGLEGAMDAVLKVFGI